MNQFESIHSLQTRDLLICTFALDGFDKISKTMKPDEVFEFIDSVSEIVCNTLQESEGRLIKIMGSSFIIIFPEEYIDLGVSMMQRLQVKLEEQFQAKNLSIKIPFSIHFGEVAIGQLGWGPARCLDILGENVSTALSVRKGGYPGRFTITPQVFQKLPENSRADFHKFTPQAVYTKEE